MQKSCSASEFPQSARRGVIELRRCGTAQDLQRSTVPSTQRGIPDQNERRARVEPRAGRRESRYEFVSDEQPGQIIGQGPGRQALRESKRARGKELMGQV